MRIAITVSIIFICSLNCWAQFTLEGRASKAGRIQIDNQEMTIQVLPGHIYLVKSESIAQLATISEVNKTESYNLPQRSRGDEGTDFILYIGLYQRNQRELIFFNDCGEEIAKYTLSISIPSYNPPKSIDQSTTRLSIRKQERAYFREIDSHWRPDTYWSFDYPLEEMKIPIWNHYCPVRVTGTFGGKRLFKKPENLGHLPADEEDSYHCGVYHEGLDVVLLSALGREQRIAAPYSGKVVAIFEKLELHGNTVVIDHGEGLLSVLSHLERITVEVGDELGRGDIVGVMGSTGATDQKHLHWMVMINGEIIDPYDLLSLFLTTNRKEN